MRIFLWCVIFLSFSADYLDTLFFERRLKFFNRFFSRERCPGLCAVENFRPEAVFSAKCGLAHRVFPARFEPPDSVFPRSDDLEEGALFFYSCCKSIHI